MTGQELRRFRERRGLERRELAELLNEALGTRYNADAIGRWERDQRSPTKAVAAFVEQLTLGEGLGLDGAGGGLQDDDLPLDGAPVGGDTVPAGPETKPQSPLSTSGLYTRACVELWELVASGVGMLGAATGSIALQQDGAIIAADREALGAAWGRLAETNDTFRKMLIGMTEGGVWLQVALVTGTTVSKCWQNHAYVAAALRAAAASEDGRVDVDESVAA